MRSHLLLLITLFLATCALNGQQEEKFRYDTEYWLKMGLSSEVIKNLSLSLDQGLRFHQDNRMKKLSFTEFSVGYSVNKEFKVFGTYRFIDRNDEDESTFNRFSLGGRYRIEPLADFRLSYRFIFESQTTDSDSNRTRLRNRVVLDYRGLNIPIEPYVGLEYFYRQEEDFDAWSDRRFKVGIEWEFIKGHELDLAFLYQREFNRKNIDVDRVWNVSYRYDI